MFLRCIGAYIVNVLLLYLLYLNFLGDTQEAEMSLKAHVYQGFSLCTGQSFSYFIHTKLIIIITS